MRAVHPTCSASNLHVSTCIYIHIICCTNDGANHSTTAASICMQHAVGCGFNTLPLRPMQDTVYVNPTRTTLRRLLRKSNSKLPTPRCIQWDHAVVCSGYPCIVPLHASRPPAGSMPCTCSVATTKNRWQSPFRVGCNDLARLDAPRSYHRPAEQRLYRTAAPRA